MSYNKRTNKLEYTDEQELKDRGLDPEVRQMNVILEVANSLDKDIQLTQDTPSQNSNGKLPCLDLQLWLEDKNQIQFEFYSKSMSNPLLILARSAVSPGVKRTTLFQEAIRRMRCCHLDLPLGEVVKHLNEFSWQMTISGYDQIFRRQIITGAVARYRQMARDHREGIKLLYRNRAQIMAHKFSKSGRSKSSWFLIDKVRQVLKLPPTPGAK